MAHKGRLLIFSGVNRRYKFIANHLLSLFPQSALVIQTNFKGDYKGKYDNQPEYDPEVVELLNRHLEKRDEIEGQYYSEDSFALSSDQPSIQIDSRTLNSDSVCEFIKSCKPTVAFTFGIGILKKPVLNLLLDVPVINLHFGITPYYRSSDTLLWPLYLQQPGHIGYTLHAIDSKIDHGPIYHQARTEFSKDDTIHDIFCKTIVQAKEPTARLLGLLMDQTALTPVTPANSGKLFFRGEFTPNHLAVIYQLVENGMLSKYLDNTWPTHQITINSCIGDYLRND